MRTGQLFTLGRLFDIQFRLHFSWFIIFILVTASLVYPNQSHWLYWVTGIITSLLFFASVVAHELAHSLVGRANGIPVTSITLFVFGGVAEMNEEITRPGAELKMAIAGPICSMAIGAIFGFFWLVIPHEAEPIVTMILWLAVMNEALAIFNLVPGFPLDGGRVLRALLWLFTGDYRYSTRIATRIGQGIGYLFIVGGGAIILLRPFTLSWFDGLWFIFIGWFLGRVASASYRQLLEQEAARQPTITANNATWLPVTSPGYSGWLVTRMGIRNANGKERNE